MKQQLVEQQYYSFNLKLSKEFLKWVHSHRLLDGDNPFAKERWINHLDEISYGFGGLYGTQFSTLDQIKSFLNAFDAMLSRQNVDVKHKHSLFYLILFLGEDYEDQSIINNRFNHLQDYAKFILDLISDSINHVQMMERDQAYEKVFDEYTQEIFFAKKELVKAMPYEDLIEYVPELKQADGIIKYLRIEFYDEELYVPEDLAIHVQSTTNRKIKSHMGSKVDILRLPKNLEYGVFTFMIKSMLDEHKRNDTEFYQEMIRKDRTLDTLKRIVSKYKRHSISNTISLVRVGTLVTDYLIKHKLLTSKRSIAGFLFEYFALLKAIRPKRAAALPEDYNELISFYIKNGISSETIRNMMKDVGGI